MGDSVRVYIPATFGMLKELADNGELTARSGWGFAVTPALLDFYTDGDEEEIAYSAFQDAAMSSLRLLAIGDEGHYPDRRVVISIDAPAEQVELWPQMGEAVVKLAPAAFSLDQVACYHVDIEDNEAATRTAIDVIDEADLGNEDAELAVGDALDNFMAYYDPTELALLTELLEP